MILYFSGTGNSRYVAQAIGKVTGDNIVSINEMVKNSSNEVQTSNTPYVFVCPTYAWRIPKIVEEFIKNTTFTGSKKAYFILTCGSETHDALHYINKLCKEKGFELLGFAGVIMPENYIAMYNAPEKEEADIIIKKALPQILSLGAQIQAEQYLTNEKVTNMSKLMSSVVNPLFYLTCVSAKGFYATDACINCGKCEKLCLLNNVVMNNQKPHWGSNCTHCMACICGCPTNAIEYKNKSKGKPRYYNTGYKG
ncbi:MAG: hypothetical protein K0S61_4457 [Anaerocolumna sp.]|jgi:flavodoxin/Pyruvate/2-oxoacid:ferredoxin oxidoreductase delta subunit|nr:hypothetical protein [Anaerocolumna sp.]